jgi:hypothetical protein
MKTMRLNAKGKTPMVITLYWPTQVLAAALSAKAPY